MNIEDDDYCTADYGVFGDNNCACSSCRPPIPKRDLAGEKRTAALRKIKEREDDTSRAFNLHLITLYNEGRRP